jgi:hypothetical protein
MASYKPSFVVTWDFLSNHPNARFVFGDNLQRWGKGGAAKLRDHPQTIGFITKKFPDTRDGSYYHPHEYTEVFEEEFQKLQARIAGSPSQTFYVSQLGGGLANRYQIWEKTIAPRLKSLEKYPNVVFCFPKP